MSRPAVSIVLLAWNAWDATHTCLETLRPTLAPGDQVIVVDNGSVDATVDELPRVPWIELIVNEENRGFAPGCNQGAARARNPVTIFLNNDTVLAPGWIEALVAPLTDPTVGAVGPRSNFVSGAQLVRDPDYRPRGVDEVIAYSRRWHWDNLGGRRDTQRLVGFCIAVRTAAFAAVDGFDEGFRIGGCEDDDLCLRLIAEGWRLVIADDAFVHHLGHASFNANGIDWAATERENAARLEAKHPEYFESRYGGAVAAATWTAVEPDPPAPLPSCDVPEGERPEVSIIVPTHNRLDRLGDALASVRDQTVRAAGVRVEVVVVNDGGVDVEPVVGPFRDALPVRVVNHPVNRGRAAACNTGIVAAAGRWLGFLDDDDVFFDHHLATCLGAIRAAGERVAPHTYCIKVQYLDGGEVVREVLGDRPFDRDLLHVTNTVVGMTPLLPADEVRAAGGFDARMRVLEDWELWLRLTRRGVRFVSVPVPTAEYRWHGRNQTTRELRRFHEGLLHVYAQHPVDADGPVGAARVATAQASAARLEHFPHDVTVVVAAADDLAAAVETLQDAARVLAGSRWELVLTVPSLELYRPLLEQLDGELHAYAVDDAGVEAAFRLGCDRAAGRHVLLVRAGEHLDPQAVLAALSGAPGAASRVGSSALVG